MDGIIEKRVTQGSLYAIRLCIKIQGVKQVSLKYIYEVTEYVPGCNDSLSLRLAWVDRAHAAFPYDDYVRTATLHATNFSTLTRISSKGHKAGILINM